VEVFPLVETVLVGGQSLTGEMLKASQRLFPAARFVQTFACSEASSSITFATVSSNSCPLTGPRHGTLEDGTSVRGFAVGKPAYHVQVSVADAMGVPLPPGVCVCVCVCITVYIYTHIRVCVCVCVLYIYIYIYINARRACYQRLFASKTAAVCVW
jgi:acyl-CoA synthetase (AMP-forming)/AMP-acid ligase II